MKKLIIGLFFLIGIIATVNYFKQKPSVDQIKEDVTTATSDAISSTIDFGTKAVNKIKTKAEKLKEVPDSLTIPEIKSIQDSTIVIKLNN